jgi:hypothetical protein
MIVVPVATITTITESRACALSRLTIELTKQSETKRPKVGSKTIFYLLQLHNILL